MVNHNRNHPGADTEYESITRGLNTEQAFPTPESERVKFLYDHIHEQGKVGVFELDPSSWTLYLYQGLVGIDKPYKITGDSIDDIVDHVHPADREKVKQAMLNAIRTGEPYTIEYRVTDPEGVSHYIESSARRVEHSETGDVFLRGVSSDITEDVLKERSLKALNKVARGALQTESVDEVAHMVADAGSDIYELSGPFVYLYDEGSGELRPAAYPQSYGGQQLPTYQPGDDIPWQVFQNLESQVIDACEIEGEFHYIDSEANKIIATPIDGRGVIIAGTTDAVGSCGSCEEAIEILSSTAEAAMSRVSQLKDIRESEIKSKKQAERYDRLNQLNDQIRTINQTIMRAGSHSEVNKSACESLAEMGQFDFAWIAEPDYAEGKLVPRSKSRAFNSYVDQTRFELDVEDSPPAVQAVEQREPVIESNIARGVQEGDWKCRALANGYRCALSVPLIHENVLHGVLTVYCTDVGSVDDQMLNTLSELGEMIGFAHQTLSQRDALVSTDNIDIRLTLGEEDEPFVQLASEIESSLEIRNISTRTDDTYLVYLSLGARIPVEDAISVFEKASFVVDYRLVSESDSALFEIVAYRDSSLFSLAEVGAELISATASGAGLSVVVSVPRGEGVQSFIDQIRSRHPDVTLHSQEERAASRDEDDPDHNISSPFDVLTPRQREILDIAYYSGYFETPRDSTATEVADSLDITPAGFSKQRRAGIRRLLDILYE